MMTAKKAARHSGNCDTRHNVHAHRDSSIITDYNHGALIAGLIIAISFGLMMIHAAVML